MTRKQFIQQLTDQLDDGIAMCGSYDPSVCGEIRRIREEVKRITIRCMRIVSADEYVNKRLDTAVADYEAANAEPDEVKNRIRGV